MTDISDNISADINKQIQEFQCDHCDKAFTRENTLVGHVNKTHKKVNVIEETKEIEIKEELIIDNVTVAEDAILTIQKFHQCDHCDKAFGRNAYLQTHINAVHKKIKRFGCHMCDYSSYQKNDIDRHQAVHLDGKNASREYRKDFRCDHCDKAFKTKRTLVGHLKIVHKKVKEFQCDECDKAYDLRENLQSHINAIHKKMKRFFCDHCDKAFSRNAHLQTHIDEFHNKIKRFGCHLCDYTSYQKTNIDRHQAVHLGGKKANRQYKKDFSCDHCDKDFKTKRTLVSHLHVIHNKIKEFQCDTCDKAFDLRENLQAHINKIGMYH
jgi:uncharacterized Zn-finger protein